MKKIIFSTILLLLVSCTSFAQRADTTKKQVPIYAVVLDSLERDQLFRLLVTIDEKPSVIKGYIAYLINKSTQLQQQPPAGVEATIPSTNKKSKP
jgi:hypothetical protein